ncbi:hypothetical protein FSARC_3962 [Fusarium sarcochroum]|uniref:Xylanolytic transcriptional activator regulatory domain-containing protein n=1 Tax=Fusarium sarcochroum TaxID=1208366 RepID=A0A8H4U2M7_9HYPO|nr:hypothetical protein FSARC_3962 [Fusarium sarcochroum]
MNREGFDATTTRVWQACVNCRRKKSSYAALYESRFKQLEELCQNLQVVATQLTQAIEKLPQSGECVSRNPQNNAATVGSLSASETLESACSLSAGHNSQPHAPLATEKLNGEEDRSPIDENIHDDPATSAFGSLVHDSYGSLRFIGGASNEFLVQSVQSLSAVSCQDIETSPFSIGSQQQTSQLGRPKLELPFFVHGLRWRDLPGLPKPEDFNLPPKYIADMLIGLYFEHYHYTFPVLYKPHFLENYKRLYTARRGTIQDDGFLSTFFAVCACSSSLTAPEGNHASFPGLEFYEKALLLHYSTTGQATKARTQCLALMSMCCAGWNTVSTSWHFAGQAVMAAQELGMHLTKVSSSDEPGRDPAPLIEAELARRIWWSIYCLDRVPDSGTKSEMSIQGLVLHAGTLVALYRLRMTNPADVRNDVDLQQCIRILGDLEATWSGASRGKAIIEQILRTFQDNPEGESLNLDFQTLFQNPELDLTGLELSDGFFENFWGTFG